MATLIRYMDSSMGCWSRVDCENGDPIWISIAQTGIVVKKSKLGWMGAQLFYEKDLYKIGQICTNLSNFVNTYNLPSDIHNPVLKLFTQLCLNCNSALEICTLLNSGRN